MYNTNRFDQQPYALRAGWPLR